jgi:hypothetical protein
VVRARALLCLWTLAVALIWLSTDRGSSWHFFHDAGQLIQSARGGGLHLWARHPEFQFGPATVAVAAGLTAIAGTHDAGAAQVVMTVLGPLIIWILEDAALADRSRTKAQVHRCGLFAGLVFMPIWDYVALGAIHLDDALAIFGVSAAIWAVARCRPIAAGLALGFAVSAKPWAAIFLPLAFALPGGVRGRALKVALVLGVGPWLPFLGGAPETMSALGHFHIPNSPASVLRVVGVRNRSTPGWDRPVQLGLGAAGVAWAVLRRRWRGAVLVGVAVRLALDPGTHLYYSAGMVVAAVSWDLLAERRTLPWTAATVAALLQLPRVVGIDPHLSGWLRLLVTVGSVALVFSHRAGDQPTAADHLAVSSLPMPTPPPERRSEGSEAPPAPSARGTR